MTVQEAIQARHSVRAYKELPLADEAVRVLVDKITELNQKGRLHMQLILNEPKAFQGTLANTANSVMSTTILSWLERRLRVSERRAKLV